ncbi:MAG: hypothetical protein NT154_36270 [Verrucomicrobia bacterium]|nr:hypothetical protein [Verrucomicrobiota bacterium]
MPEQEILSRPPFTNRAFFGPPVPLPNSDESVMNRRHAALSNGIPSTASSRIRQERVLFDLNETFISINEINGVMCFVAGHRWSSSPCSTALKALKKKLNKGLHKSDDAIQFPQMLGGNQQCWMQTSSESSNC